MAIWEGTSSSSATTREESSRDVWASSNGKVQPLPHLRVRFHSHRSSLRLWSKILWRPHVQSCGLHSTMFTRHLLVRSVDHSCNEFRSYTQQGVSSSTWVSLKGRISKLANASSCDLWSDQSFFQRFMGGKLLRRKWNQGLHAQDSSISSQNLSTFETRTRLVWFIAHHCSHTWPLGPTWLEK